MVFVGRPDYLKMRRAQTGILATGGAAWTPLQLSPTFFHDSRAVDMASDGSSWLDRMGNYPYSASGTAKPVFNASALNGRPAFVTDGINDVMTGARVTQWQNITKFSLWMVGKRSVINHDHGVFTDFTSLVHYSDDTIYTQLYTGGANYGAAASSNAFHYSLFQCDLTQPTPATKMILYINGVQQTLSFTGTLPSVTENNAGSLLAIGRYVSIFLAGTHVEDGLVCGSVLSAPDMANLFSYHATTYGL